MIDYVSDAISAVTGVIDGEVTLSDFFSLVYNIVFKAVFLFIKNFFSNSKDFFIELGDDFSNLFTSHSFSDHWLLWVLGIFVGIYLLKCIIEFAMKLLDIT